MKFKMMLKQFKLNILRYWNKGNSFTDCIKKLCGCHAFWCLWINLVQTWYDHNDDRYYWTLQFDTSLLDLDLDSKVTGMQESKHFCAKYLTKYSINWDRIWYTVETFWCDKSYIDVILSIQLSREKSLLMWFRSFFVFVFVFCFALAYIQTFRNQMFSNLVVWWRPLCTTFWYQFGWPWLSFKVTVVWEIKTSVSILSEISLLIWMKFTILPQPVGLLKLLLNLVFTIKIQMRKHCWWCFIFYGGGKKKKKKKYIYMGVCQDTCELIWFKHGMMLDRTKVCSMIPVLMILKFTQGHRVMGKLELVQSVCCEVAWSNSNVCDGWWWLWRSPVIMANIDHISICSSCFWSIE